MRRGRTRVFKGFTADFAFELFEIREMFELRSARAFVALPDSSPRWRQIEALRAEHLGLLREVEHRYHDSSDLDSRFHRLINSAGRMTADITFRRNWRKLLFSKARLS